MNQDHSSSSPEAKCIFIISCVNTPAPVWNDVADRVLVQVEGLIFLYGLSVQ